MGMEVIRAADYDELSVCAAEMIIQTVKSKNDAVLGLATGSTPIGTYKRLIEAYQQGRVSFAAAKSINLDEYVGLGENDPNSYRRFMNDMFFNNIDIDVRNTYVPDGLNKNIQQECMRYDMLYKRLGGADIQLLGIGVNAHIGFNEPADKLVAATHVVKLSQSTRMANSRNFASAQAVPEYAVTLGMAGILKAKKIVLLASGEAKREAVAKAVYGDIDTHAPASFLQLHDNVTVICDFCLAK